MVTEASECGQFILTFVGGDMSGRVLDSQSPTPQERTVVEMFLGASNRGQIGCETRSLISYQAILNNQMLDALEAADQQGLATNLHAYKAIRREEKNGVCHLQVECTIINMFVDQPRPAIKPSLSNAQRSGT